MSEMKARREYARICVQIDLMKHLVPKVWINSSPYIVEYEGLHSICFHCGKYGHKEECSELYPVMSQSRVGQQNFSDQPGEEDDGLQKSRQPEFGLWMLAKQRVHPTQSTIRGEQQNNRSTNDNMTDSGMNNGHKRERTLRIILLVLDPNLGFLMIRAMTKR